ncbi:MAG: methyl-accepting chemotaxis protein [Desulfovibrionaceae bacterium]|nr:methyl-accepting chemotaxis protein [Desulfovibrionaceae bacterium]
MQTPASATWRNLFQTIKNSVSIVASVAGIVLVLVWMANNHIETLIEASQATLEERNEALGRLMQNQQEISAGSVLDSLVLGSGGLINNYDFEPLKRMLTIREQNPFIASACFVNGDGSPLKDLENAPLQSGSPVDGGKVLSKPVLFGDTVVGHVELGLDPAPIRIKIQELAAANARTKADALDFKNRVQKTMMVSGAGLLLAATVLIVMFQKMSLNRLLVRPMRRLADCAEKIAAGQLDIEVDIRRDDEVGMLADAFRAMMRSLKRSIEDAEAKSREIEQQARLADQAKEAAESERTRVSGLLTAMTEMATQATDYADRLATASEELAAQSEQIARSADSQRQRLAETTSAIGQMDSTVTDMARNAGDAAQTADEVKKKAEQGAGTVASVVDATTQVQRKVAEMKVSLDDLGDKAERIGAVMNVIADIADQTNLLALNAAIEAARAGDHGRGFAVVADEVRKLAEKTMTATKEVEQAISSIQDGTRRNISEMDGAVAAVARCTTLSGEAGRALQEIVQVITSNAAQVGSMAAAAEQQSMSTKQISHNVGEINGIVSETAGGIRQTDQAVRDLSDLAQGLHGLIAEINKAANGPTATEVSGETARSMFLQDGEARTSPPRRADRW